MQAWPYQDDLKQHLLIDLEKFLVPFINIGGFSSRIRLVICRRGRVGTMVVAPFDDFGQYRFVYLHGPSEYHRASTKRRRLTLSRGMASLSASGTSIRICFRSIDRSATWRSTPLPSLAHLPLDIEALIESRVVFTHPLQSPRYRCFGA
jgi:hypothetical protein